MFYKILFITNFLFISSSIFADYTLDTNHDGLYDIIVKELTDNSIIISSDTNFDGKIDKKLALDDKNLSIFEETDYNLDGIMDNFYYYECGYVVRQEVDSNYDNKIDIWVHITNEGKSILKYEKDIDFDGIIDKVKEFEVYKEENGR